MPHIRFVAYLALALLVGASGVACSPGGGAQPPNSLTALLRALPQTGDAARVSFDFGDLAAARSQVGEKGDLPLAVRAGVLRSDTPGFDENAGWQMSDVEAWVDVSPTGAPRYEMIVGHFDQARIETNLRSSGWTSRSVGVFDVFSHPSGSIGDSAPTTDSAAIGGGVAVAERRLVYAASDEAVETVASFRGGNDSLLALPGLGDLAVASGKAAAIAAFAPSAGCPNPDWTAAAVRYEPTKATPAAVFEYGRPGQAEDASAALRENLPAALPGGVKVQVVDARGRISVAALESSWGEADAIVAGASPGGALDGLPRCPK